MSGIGGYLRDVGHVHDFVFTLDRDNCRATSNAMEAVTLHLSWRMRVNAYAVMP